MNPTIVSVGIWCAVAFVAALAFVALAALNGKGVNPLDEIFGRYRKQSVLGLILLPILIIKLIAFASVKAPTNDASPMVGMAWPGRQAPVPWFESGFTSNELASGYALWRVGTNEVWNFDLMPGAHVIESWRLRGAAVDWAVCATTNLGPVAMTTDGRLVTTNGVFTAYDGQLAIVPEVNWTLLGTNAPSRAWWAETPWESTVFTWQNAFLGRDTNTPVSVQAEFTREGDFICRHDLAAAGTNLTSELYYRIRSEDMEEGDRDGDGLTTIDEVSVYHTDPGLVDSDGDGLTDGAEVANGTDPTTRSVPNEEIVARIVGSPTNELYGSATSFKPELQLSALKLWDGFAADWPEGMTNLVYERTLNLGTVNGWQQYFLSSKADAAGDWDLRGLVLEWDDGAGNCGTALASPYGDSLPLPLTNSTVTIRLRAIGPKVRSPKPMYLIGYTPSVEISGGTTIYDESGDERAFYFSAGNGNMALSVTIDRSHRPCKAAPSADELALPGLADMELGSGGVMTYEGNENGGMITVTRPGCFQLPAFEVDDPFTPDPRPRLMAPRGGAGDGEGKWILCLDPSIDFSGDHKFVSTGFSYNPENGDYDIVYSYPLDSKCLWRGWQKSATGCWNCLCEPEVAAGGGADELPFVEKTYEINDAGTVATGFVKVFGRQVWTGTATHSWRDVGEGGGVSCGSQRLSEEDECGDCEAGCADGDCDKASGSDVNSVKFRLSLGMPRQGQHSGFVYFESEEPVAVTMGLFAVKSRDDADVTDETSGVGRTITCHDANGRRVAMAPMTGGVRLTVTVSETQELEDVWEVFNEGGGTSVIRIRQLSRLYNIMSDETYACDGDGVWSKTDNITGVVETLERVNLVNDPTDGKLYETRTTRDADGNQLDRVYTESSRIGSFGNAVLRETYWEQDTGSQVKWRSATYWNDAAHLDRHGQLKLLTGNCVAWEYHDYDERGFETLRVEQRNGSAVPTAFPEVIAGDLYWANGLADAFVTVYDYTPFAGDDNHPDDMDKVRRETRYVVRNGRLTRIARTWTCYTHTWCNGYEAVQAETWRASSATATRSDPANAYSRVIAYSETGAYVPLVLRGEVAEELDEDGALACRFVWEGWASVTEETHKWFGGVEFPTYEVVEHDSDFGNEIRRATYLSDSCELVDEAISTYDEKNRLRSTTYMDGTSETNAWSCCRKLWSSDRQGRKTLRSAVTGQDRLYYADEEVWLRGVSTNGKYRVTQHFFDGLGRETETVTRIGGTPGAYAEPFASSPTGEDFVSSAATAYPDGGDGCVISVDARGKMTVRERTEYEDRVESVVSVYGDECASSPDLQTRDLQYRNGTGVTEKSWDGKWTRETETADYDADGCEVRYEVVVSSDCGTVTNRVTRSDFLGRTVLEETPLGTTATAYRGATTRVESTALSATGVLRVEEPVYNAWGESVGSVQDGVTNRTDECYETDPDGNWWKVTRSVTASATEVASVSERREQLTGRGAGVVCRRIGVDADGVTEETVEEFDSANGESVTVVSNAVQGVTTSVAQYGLIQERFAPDRTDSYGYDALGRRAASKRLLEGTFAWSEALSYDAAGAVVARRTYTNATDFATETYAYDSYGRRVSATDALGNVKVTQYDAVGNVVEQGGATWPVRYEYDTAGRRVSLSTTKDGRIWDVTRWSYDPQTGKCIAKRYPDGSQVSYAFMPDGLPYATTKASGAWTRNFYDAKRLLVGTDSSDGAGDAAFAYDAFGKMTDAANGGAQYFYARHRGGIVTNETAWWTGGSSRTLTRTVDGFGRLAGRGVSDQDSQAIVYDGQGRVAMIPSAAANVTYAYGDGGVDAGYTLALHGGATVERHVVRDAYRPGLIVAVYNFVNGVAVGGESYAHDAKGRIVERVENVERVERIGYDAIGQVIRETIEQSEQSEQSNNYSYDQIGNIAGSEALAYTADGEVTGLGGLSFGYDSASRLTTVSTGDVTIATYAYDAFDRRVRKTTAEATTTYLYDGWNLVREEIAGTNGTTDVIEYYWGKDISGSLDTAGGIGGLLYLKRNGTVYVPLYDASGNVTAYVDASGNVVAAFVYDAFGNTVAEDGTMAGVFRFKYSTKYFDVETGLIYYGYRYYAPPAARWLTRDPLEEQGGLNLHCFCENDGVNRYDALGLSATVDLNAQAFWKDIEKRLNDDLKYEWTARFLNKSLQTNFDRRNAWEYSERPSLGKEIQGTSEYQVDVRNLIDNAVPNAPHVNQQSQLKYKNGDLHAAIEVANVRYRGKICKRKKNKWTWELKVNVSGRFDYQEWRFADIPNFDTKLAGLYSDAIVAFDWETNFEENGSRIIR